MDDNIVERVKQANPIEDVIGQEHTLGGRGRYRRAKAHDSLVVDTRLQLYNWNSQSEAGDVISWVEARQGCDFKTAIEWLCRRAGIQEPDWGKQDAATRIAARKREDAWEIAARLMSTWLWEDGQALNYARSRGWSDETIRAARLGYSGNRDQATDRRKAMNAELHLHGVDIHGPDAVAICGYKGDVAAWASQRGITPDPDWVAKGYVPGLIGRDMLVYPHVTMGRVRYFSGRGVHEKHHYNLPVDLAGPRQIYVNRAWSPKEETCVIVEGQADAVTLDEWQVPALALVGVSAHEGIEKLLDHHDVLYVGLDADTAGEKARQKLGALLGPMTRLVQWPRAEESDKDANDWLKRMQADQADPDKQREMVKRVLNASRTYAEHLAQRAGDLKGAERDAAIKAALDVIAQMDDEQFAMYNRQLAKAMGYGVPQLREALKQRKRATEDQAHLRYVETLGGPIHGYLIEYLYDPKEDKASLAWRTPEGTILQGDYVDIEGDRYIPANPNRMIQDGGVLFPSELGPRKSTRELVAYVELFVNQHYLVGDKKLSRMIAYYVMLTWVYDAFNALPYLRAMGEAGAGKSELMRRVGFVCYRMMAASGANSAASFFRTVEKYRGTVFIDEADLHDGGDMTNDLVKFLNLGAMKGNPIWRLAETTNTDGEKDFETITYTTFCPKLIAMRRDFKDDAVGTRSITLKLMPREPIELVQAGVKFHINEEFRQKALHLRNMLLRWRLEKWQPEIEIDEEDIDLEISSRLNQVTLPLLAIAKDDAELKADIRRYLREYNSEMILSRSMTIEARIVEAMWKIYTEAPLRLVAMGVEPDGREYIYTGRIAKTANQIIDEMNKTDGEEDDEDDEDKPIRKKRTELSPHRTGKIIREVLQIKSGVKKTAGVPVYWDEIKMIALAKRYGVSIPADYEEKTNGKCLS